MTLGDRVRKKREEMNLSQEELAERLGYKSKTSIHKIEQGLTDLPVSKVKQLAKVLDVTAAYLMGWDHNYYYENDGLGYAGEYSPDNIVKKFFDLEDLEPKKTYLKFNTYQKKLDLLQIYISSKDFSSLPRIIKNHIKEVFRETADILEKMIDIKYETTYDETYFENVKNGILPNKLQHVDDKLIKFVTDERASREDCIVVRIFLDRYKINSSYFLIKKYDIMKENIENFERYLIKYQGEEFLSVLTKAQDGHILLLLSNDKPIGSHNLWHHINTEDFEIIGKVIFWWDN